MRCEEITLQSVSAIDSGYSLTDVLGALMIAIVLVAAIRQLIRRSAGVLARWRAGVLAGPAGGTPALRSSDHRTRAICTLGSCEALSVVEP